MIEYNNILNVMDLGDDSYLITYIPNMKDNDINPSLLFNNMRPEAATLIFLFLYQQLLLHTLEFICLEGPPVTAPPPGSREYFSAGGSRSPSKAG